MITFPVSWFQLWLSPLIFSPRFRESKCVSVVLLQQGCELSTSDAAWFIVVFFCFHLHGNVGVRAL